MTTTHSPFAGWLLERVGERGLKYADLARKLRVSRSTVSSWVSGWVLPRPYQRAALAEALGLTLEEVQAEITKAELAKGRPQAATIQADEQRAAEQQPSAQEVLRATGHLSTVMSSEDATTQTVRQIDAWVRSLPPERQAAVLELRPVIEVMAAKFVERDPREAWRVAELWLKYRSSADGLHQTITSPD